jgi:thiamine pyrophosphokinase
MSSHHIVKDNQEPALIIANGEPCSAELMGQLLEWSPVVLVLDGAIHQVLSLGIKVDIYLGDFDRNNQPDEVLKIQPQIAIIHTPDQSKTDLEKGIELLIQKGHKAANILWATGKRADHNLNNLTLIARYKQRINLVIYDDYSKVFVLPTKFSKFYTAGTPISIMPIGTVTGISSSGLKYELQNDTLELGYRVGSSNEAATNGIVHIHHEQGDLLMMECMD